MKILLAISVVQDAVQCTRYLRSLENIYSNESGYGTD